PFSATPSLLSTNTNIFPEFFGALTVIRYGSFRMLCMTDPFLFAPIQLPMIVPHKLIRPCRSLLAEHIVRVRKYGHFLKRLLMERVHRVHELYEEFVSEERLKVLCEFLALHFKPRVKSSHLSYLLTV